jgi:hypothetical protein
MGWYKFPLTRFVFKILKYFFLYSLASNLMKKERKNRDWLDYGG